MSERELCEVPEEVVIAAYSPIISHDQQLLILRPVETFDCSFVPLTS